MFGLFGYPVMTSFKSDLWDGTANYLILAGGGGGGGVIDGGGGAGGYRASWGTGTDGTSGNSGGLSSLETALNLNSGIAYSITVGQGGQGALGYNNTTNMRGHKGRTSSISGSDITTVTTTGGGGGSGYANGNHTDRNGGSGGGAAYASYTGGTGTTGEGFAGGNGVISNEAGGGGGAGAVGGNASADVGGDGGDGLASTITGSSITRAGGGGGGTRSTRPPGDGGAGGGGGGGDDTLSPSNYVDGNGGNEAEHGRGQYGGGGGGAGFSALSNAQIGGSGGSGAVVLRLPEVANYNATKLASDVSSASNCTASYLNTQVYTDDTDFDDVVLLMDGNSTTTDLSSQNQTVTEQNTSTTVSSETDPFGNTQNVLNFSRTDATGSGILVSANPIKFGNDPFTIEMWVKLDTLGVTHTLYCDRDTSNTCIAAFRVNASNTIQFFKDTSGGGSITGSTVLTTGTWYHVALTYDSSTVRLFLDGNLEVSSNQTLTFNSSNIPVLGYDPLFPETTYQLDGRMTQVRVTKGVARYNGSFTAPTSAFPSPTNTTGGDHVISFTVTTETSHPGDASDNDGTITWTPSI